MKNSFLIFGFLIFAACGPKTSGTRLNATVYPPKAENCPIQIMTRPPSSSYEEVCLVNGTGGQGGGQSKNAGDLFPEMMKVACKCGADAIILLNSTDGHLNFDAPVTPSSASGVAIKFKE